ncbi:ClpX C4-type zinc finger protein [Actinocrispum sp. NPDC049592]|uniref:ClpX C4-type zinc finger protein n=1 Tax=Actinocrispum sp. NPDC049592 TaxID=3154835 RepID=UPI00343A3FB0
MSEACSFCGAGRAQVGYLFTGPEVWICDGCVRASYEILQGLDQNKSAAAVPMDDPVMATIAQVQQAALRGHKEQAKSAYEQLWAKAEKPLHRVSIAHYMADLQDDPAEELLWDERALEAAAEVTPEHEDAGAVAPLRASLHVNAATALNKLGRPEDARKQLDAARAAEATLPEEGYGRLVRTQIEALAADLDGQQTLL